ncbi:hypothetical protein V1523DRAFT_194931 [Lipomyces doorenjongii]
MDAYSRRAAASSAAARRIGFRGIHACFQRVSRKGLFHLNHIVTRFRARKEQVYNALDQALLVESVIEMHRKSTLRLDARLQWTPFCEFLALWLVTQFKNEALRDILSLLSEANRSLFESNKFKLTVSGLIAIYDLVDPIPRDPMVNPTSLFNIKVPRITETVEILFDKVWIEDLAWGRRATFKLAFRRILQVFGTQCGPKMQQYFHVEFRNYFARHCSVYPHFQKSNMFSKTPTIHRGSASWLVASSPGDLASGFLGKNITGADFLASVYAAPRSPLEGKDVHYLQQFLDGEDDE